MGKSPAKVILLPDGNNRGSPDTVPDRRAQWCGQIHVLRHGSGPRVAAPFINADIIQRDELRDPSPKASYHAAEIAAERRREFMADGRSFVMETVFSHPSKLDLLNDARAAGYRIIVFHLMLASPALAVARVAERISEGGHPVPEEKIRTRFDRNGPLIRKAAMLADRAMIFDASALNEAPVMPVELASGQIVRRADKVPEWFDGLYRDLG
ncbi:zeta toxin family protein [Parasphingorhabdus halotolerans]|uniref:zeta toxin family protein n=1 Tax=Parasphingorhabdus halotolerans TaxID=2725558 RepID=UPI001B3A19C8|nr:zeta toxin family protein [Parasphingorhabdus halotolerans]